VKDISQLVPDAQAFDRAVVAGLHVAVDATIKRTKLRARLQHIWKDRTYATRETIDGDAAATSAGSVGVLAAGANAIRLNNGTPPHEIRARRKKFLRFQQGGVTRFAKSVQHPGTRPDPYLEAAQDFAGEEIDRAVGAMLDGLL
jgi:hypothetical protein